MPHQIDEDDLTEVWALVNELTEQLANNRALVQQLKARTENVKGQAVHVGAGFPLRRFNLDISDEEFQTELEAFASHLVLENQTLQHENKQLNTLLKEYEQTLETVMGKFRGVAHASQHHDLALHSYYSQLLQSLQTAHSTAQLHDDTSLSLLLTRLSTLLRSALRNSNGEDVDTELLDNLTLEEPRGPASTSPAASAPSPHSSPTRSPERGGGSGGATSSGGATGSSGATSSAGASGTAETTSSMAGTSSAGPTTSSGTSGARRRRGEFGFLPGTSGGYFGTEGQGDWALEREMEIQRLEDENKALREMLGIANEAPSTPPPQEPPHSPIIGEDRRLSSLTIDELEADAEKEEAEKERLGDVSEQQVEEQKVDESVLGIRAQADQAPPPENVFDETEGEIA